MNEVYFILIGLGTGVCTGIIIMLGSEILITISNYYKKNKSKP